MDITNELARLKEAYNDGSMTIVEYDERCCELERRRSAKTSITFMAAPTSMPERKGKGSEPGQYM